MKRWALAFVAVWICGILFPFESVRNYSSAYRQSFDAVFDHESAHIVAHTLLFAVLAVALECVRKWRAAWMILAVSLAIACVQELIQALTGNDYHYMDGLFDLGVDLVSAMVGLFVFRLARGARHRLESRA